ESQDVKNDCLAVTEPTIVQEAAFGLPSMRHGSFAVLCPGPVDALIQRLGQPPDLRLTRRIAGEVSARGQNSSRQKRCIHHGKLRLPNTPAGLHIEKVIVEASITCSCRTLILGTVIK